MTWFPETEGRITQHLVTAGRNMTLPIEKVVLEYGIEKLDFKHSHSLVANLVANENNMFVTNTTLHQNEDYF